MVERGLNPNSAVQLIDATSQYVVTDPGLTLDTMLALAGVLGALGDGAITNYQVEGVARSISGNSVIEPALDGANMQAILAVFRDQRALPDDLAPPAPLETTSTTATGEVATGEVATGEVATGDVAPPVENASGVVPPADIRC